MVKSSDAAEPQTEQQPAEEPVPSQIHYGTADQDVAFSHNDRLLSFTKGARVSADHPLHWFMRENKLPVTWDA